MHILHLKVALVGSDSSSYYFDPDCVDDSSYILLDYLLARAALQKIRSSSKHLFPPFLQMLKGQYLYLHSSTLHSLLLQFFFLLSLCYISLKKLHNYMVTKIICLQIGIASMKK